MITLKTFVFNDFYVNTFVLYDDTKECVIIDPGCNDKSQRDELAAFINEQALIPVMLINTHGHFDHVAGDRYVKSAWQIPLALHEKDKPLLDDTLHYAEFFSIEVEQPPEPDLFLKEGDVVKFGVSELVVLHIPGHSPGSIVLYSKAGSLLVAGDVLFKGSIGRTDLPGGNYNVLIKGITEKLMTLPRETRVFPGHGPATSIGLEYDTNPFLQDR